VLRGVGKVQPRTGLEDLEDVVNV